MRSSSKTLSILNRLFQSMGKDANSNMELLPLEARLLQSTTLPILPAASTSSGTLNAPSALVLSLQTSNSVKLDWHDNSPSASGYFVLRSTGSGFSTVAVVSSPAASTYVDQNLLTGQSYKYEVQAYNGSHSSTVSNTASITVPSLVPPAVNPVVTINPSANIAGPSPTISGAPTASIGVNYTLKLNPNGMGNITNWSINWGDGTYGTIGNALSYNHIFVRSSGTADSITASAITSNGDTYNATTSVQLTQAPVVQAFQVNDGSASRSAVTSLTVSFNQPVTLAAGAFSIKETARSGSLHPAEFGSVIAASNGGATYTLSFPQSVFAADLSSSLPNGTYALSVAPAKVTDSNGVPMEFSQRFNFYRLAGDSTGSGAAGSVNYHPTVSINPLAAATSGNPLTISLKAATFGNNGDKTTYQWIVKDNGTEVMLPGSYGNGMPLPTSENPISPVGSVLTSTPQLTFIPSGPAGSWTVQVVETDTDLNLSSTTTVMPFSVAANATVDRLVTQVSPSTRGLNTLSFNGVTILDGGNLGDYTNISSQLSDGSTPGAFYDQYNAATNTYNVNSTTLSSSVQYTRLANELDFTFTVKNNAPLLSGLYFSQFIFTLAYDLENLQGGDVISLPQNASVSSVNIVSNGQVVGTAALGLEEQTPGHIAIASSGSGGLLYAQFDTLPDLSQGQAPALLYPGQTATYHSFLRFSTVANANLGSDAQQALSTQNYQSASAALQASLANINWSDRRPITELFPFTNAFINPNTNTNLAFNLLSYASREIDTMLQDGSQGAISWDISDPANASAYDGAPELATTLIPQLGEPVVAMNLGLNPTIGRYYDPSAAGTLIGEYFAMFRNAGLETGLTLRDSQAFPQVQIGAIWQGPSANPAALLIGRIEYAKQNWGCTLFYIDSSIAGAQQTRVLAEVHAAEPDVLLIPEHLSDADFANAGGYYQEPFSSSIVRTPGISDVASSGVQIAFPTGFIITRADLSPSFTAADTATMAQALAEGDTFFIQDNNSAITAQQSLAFNNSTGLVDFNNNTITVRLVTAPDGAAMQEFLLNGNIILSRQQTALQYNINDRTFSAQNVYATTPLTFNFAGTGNTLVIDTAGGDPLPGGYILNGDLGLTDLVTILI